MEISIRNARPEDARFVVPLIYSSGPHEFDYIFNVGNKTVQDYLSFAFPTTMGTQSHRVFLVATVHEEIAGLGAFYTGRENTGLSLGNAWNVLRFYGLRNLVKVSQRASHIETIIPPADADVGFISQLGVKEEFRGHGAGTAILQHQIELARSLKLQKCMLDVAVTNPRAQALYERLGFRVIQENPWNYSNLDHHVPGQRRMELPL